MKGTLAGPQAGHKGEIRLEWAFDQVGKTDRVGVTKALDLIVDLVPAS